MIDAVMYGYTPLAMMLKFCSAPPLSRFKTLKIPLASLLSSWLSAPRSTPITGTWATN